VATPDQWPKIKEIVGAALEREPSERIAFLDQACAQNSELRPEVESLLAAHADADGLSEHPWTTKVTEAAGESKIVGPYRLIRELGVGGMGQVWLAEQTEPVQRNVAVKLIRAGMYDAAVVQRFQSERQSLALMDHPAIAKVFDAGATPAGQPYFAMEYVDGLPITEYCDREKLGIRDRLELFIQVCQGVQHAHQKAIIHRDLKPSNVLVVEVDGKPMPRIIDFGLAKATAPAMPGETLFTQVGTFLGTPGYISPEQADPEVQDVDTRTDVYSLGVVLYELLTGFLPFDTTLWKKQRLDEVLRQLRDTDPQSPSTKVSTNRDTSTARAEARGTEARQLVTLLRGDLDWITLKALDKDRERRYGTSLALAADLENYLQNRPVEARPASAAYRVRKYVRRHAVAVAVASGAAMLLIAFAATQAVQLRRTTRERDRADRITEFMTSMFKVADPSEARGNSITAREILDKSSNEIDTGLANDPQLQVRLMGTMGEVYTNLGLYSKAQKTLEGAVAAAHRLGDTSDASAFNSANMLSYVMIQQGKSADAEKMLRETIDSEQRGLGPEHPTTLTAKRFLAFALESEGRYDEAEKIQRGVLDGMRRTLGPENTETLLAMNEMANIAQDQGNLPEAERLYREAMETLRRVFGPENQVTLLATSNLANVLRDEGRRAEAEQMLRELLETKRRLLGPEHPQTLTVMHNLANVLTDLGRKEEAEKLFRQTVEIENRVRGPENPSTLSTVRSLAFLLHGEGLNAEAEKLQREVLQTGQRVFGPEHPFTLEVMGALAITLASEGKLDAAKKLHSARLDIASRKPGQAGLADAWYDYACGANQAGRRDEAFDHLRRAIDHGYWDAEQMRIDDDLKSMRGDPRFEALIAEAQKRAAASAQKPN
jgi:serine/threonine protein kinase